MTSGIWMWSEPIRLANGEHLLLLDSEGTERGDDKYVPLIPLFFDLLSKENRQSQSIDHKRSSYAIYRIRKVSKAKF